MLTSPYSERPLVSIITHSTTAETLFLEDQRIVEIVVGYEVGGSKIEITEAVLFALGNELTEQQIERSHPFAFFVGRDILRLGGLGIHI